MSLEDDAVRQLDAEANRRAKDADERLALTYEFADWIVRHGLQPIPIYETWEKPSYYDSYETVFSKDPIASGWPFGNNALLVDRRTIISLRVAPRHGTNDRAGARDLKPLGILNSALRESMVQHIKYMKILGLA